MDTAMDLASFGAVKVYAATGLNGLEISEGKIVAYHPEGADDTDRLWDEIEVIMILDSQLKSLPPLPPGLKGLSQLPA